MTPAETELRAMACDGELSAPRRDASAWAVGEIERLRAELAAWDRAMRGRTFSVSELDTARAENATMRAQLEAARGALVALLDLTCEAIEDDDGNSGCGQCECDCTGCIAYKALALLDRTPSTEGGE